MKTNTHVWSFLAQFVLAWEMFQVKPAEKIKTHILCPITFFENCAFYEMWKNMAKPDRSDDKMVHAQSMLGT